MLCIIKLEYLKTNHVDLIITDVRMLEVSGIEVARYVYERKLKTKVVILSGYQDFSYAQQAINYKVRAYLTKPTEPTELQKLLKEIKMELDREISSERNGVAEEEVTLGKGNDEQNMMEKTLVYINENYDKELSLKKVADLLYLSEDYFGRVFKKNMGCNFTDYLLSVRMKNAIRLLKTGDYTVQEISEMLGYKNSNYFIKIFKEYTGYTPKKFPRFMEENHED